MTWIILGVVIFAAIVLMGRAHSRYLDRQEDLWKIYHALENGAPTKLNFMMKELKEVHQEQAVLAVTPEMMNVRFIIISVTATIGIVTGDEHRIVDSEHIIEARTIEADDELDALDARGRVSLPQR